jgi:cobalt-zinc-cadmium efflux system protein
MADALGSVGAIGAGLAIWGFGWYWVDPAASALIGLLVVYSAWRLVLEAVRVLMESAPAAIDVDEVRDSILATPGVGAVHDLHVWTITSGMDSLSAHVIAQPGHGHAILLRAVRETLHHRFGIHHVTIQIEPDGFEGCSTDCPAHAASTPR